MKFSFVWIYFLRLGYFDIDAIHFENIFQNMILLIVKIKPMDKGNGYYVIQKQVITTWFIQQCKTQDLCVCCFEFEITTLSTNTHRHLIIRHKNSS